jgi:hypothetical protein
MLTHALNSIQLINPYSPAEFVSTAVNGLFTYSTVHNFSEKKKKSISVVRHVTGNDQDYLRKIPRVVVQKSALL